MDNHSLSKDMITFTRFFRANTWATQWSFHSEGTPPTQEECERRIAKLVALRLSGAPFGPRMMRLYNDHVAMLTEMSRD